MRIGQFLIGTILFLLGAIMICVPAHLEETDFGEKKIVPCLDEYNREIIGLECVDYSYKYQKLFFPLSVLGIVLVIGGGLHAGFAFIPK